jgi:hypothetical protein
MMFQKIIPLLFITLLAACEGCKDDPAPKTELEKLPPATQEGKNTFGCLVNGKAWVTETSIDAVAAYQLGLLTIGADIDNPPQSIGLLIIENGIIVSINNNYDLTQTNESNARFNSEESFGVCFYERENTLSGELLLTKFDKINLVVAGTFQFTTATSDCDTIKVTDGRFDLTYAN